ncbi:tRNA 2-thiouridine(34) synthase MnmA, partial [cyanobacterium TDX16]
AAALLLQQGHDVVGVTLKLWGGESDTGCCSVSDVDDARHVADRLGIEHHVFGFGEDFERHVVGPYVEDHALGRTPNPCIECNRHVKFDRLLRRAEALGFDHLATGHHAQVVGAADGTLRVARGEDRAKDQSYVLSMLGQDALRRVVLPVGDRSKDDVRALAGELGLVTATKPDSQEVCFIPSAVGGRTEFLARRTSLTPGRVVDATGAEVGEVDAVEAVTVGQRRGLALAGGGDRRYVTDVDVASATVTVGAADELLASSLVLHRLAWSSTPASGAVLAQCSAHGPVAPAQLAGDELVWDEPRRRVAPGQTVAFYDPMAPDQVVGSGVVAS